MSRVLEHSPASALSFRAAGQVVAIYVAAAADPSRVGPAGMERARRQSIGHRSAVEAWRTACGATHGRGWSSWMALVIAGCGAESSTSTDEIERMEKRVQDAEREAEEAQAAADDARQSGKRAESSEERVEDEPVEEESAEEQAEDTTECIKIPNVVGKDHQLAQDTMQGSRPVHAHGRGRERPGSDVAVRSQLDDGASAPKGWRMRRRGGLKSCSTPSRTMSGSGGVVCGSLSASARGGRIRRRSPGQGRSNRRRSI